MNPFASLNRFDRFGIIFSIASLVFCVFGLQQMQSNTEDVLQWLPDKSEARENYNLFRQHFGSDDFLIVSWKDCTLDDDRLDYFSRLIGESDHEGLIEDVISGASVASRLRSQMKLSDAEIKRRLRGVFFGIDDPELTCVLIELSPHGTSHRTKSIRFVWDAINATPDLNRDDVTIGGYPYVATYVDQQLRNSFRYFLIPSVVLATLVALLCLRNVVLTLIVFVAAVGAAAVSTAFVPVCGAKMGGLMSIVPALVFVLATSGSIHLVRYGLNVIGEPGKLLAIGWKPCTISAVTTAIGMLSLTRSDFPAIRNFGFFSATGVGFALAFQLLVVPWLLSRFGQSGSRQLAARSDGLGFWQWLMMGVSKHRLAISLFSLLLFATAAIGLTQLRAEVEVEKLFATDSQILKSLRSLEDRLGPLDQTEVLLVFKNIDPEQFPDRVKYLRQVQMALSELPQVSLAHSLINYLPREPAKGSASSFFRWSTYRNMLRRERESLANNNFLFRDDGVEMWRISLRFPFTRENDFGQLAADVEATTQMIAQRSPVELLAAPDCIYTGKTHLFQHAQMTLLRDLFQNFLLAFAIITPILIIVLRSLPIGLIAMLPNLFPVMVVFGGLGWCDFPVDLAIAMTASVALGIAVDDTTHFLIRFRDFGGNLQNVSQPIHSTIRQCGPAMLHTTLIAAAGLMVYYFSELLVVSRFAWAISLLLTIALIADVVILPALLFLVSSYSANENAIGPADSVEEKILRLQREEIEIAAYDSSWPRKFLEEKAWLLQHLPSDLVYRVEHIGSTAIPGMAAKPIVDLLVGVRCLEQVKKRIVPVMEAAGYEYLWRPTAGNEGPPWYAWFIKRGTNGRRTHHIHMVERDFREHWNRLEFRDFLIDDADAADRYATLKFELARKFPNDRAKYTAGKAAFIDEIKRAQ